MEQERKEEIKQKLVKEIEDAVREELPDGTLWRDTYSKKIAERVFIKFFIRGKRCCKDS